MLIRDALDSFYWRYASIERHSWAMEALHVLGIYSDRSIISSSCRQLLSIPQQPLHEQGVQIDRSRWPRPQRSIHTPHLHKRIQASLLLKIETGPPGPSPWRRLRRCCSSLRECSYNDSCCTPFHCILPLSYYPLPCLVVGTWYLYLVSLIPSISIDPRILAF